MKSTWTNCCRYTLSNKHKILCWMALLIYLFVEVFFPTLIFSFFLLFVHSNGVVLSSDADTSGLTLKQDVTGILCMHERDDENGFYAIDLPEQSHPLSNEKIQLDEIIASSTSYVEHGQLCQNEFEDATLNRNCDQAIGNSTNPTRVGN